MILTSYKVKEVWVFAARCVMERESNYILVEQASLLVVLPKGCGLKK